MLFKTNIIIHFMYSYFVFLLLEEGDAQLPHINPYKNTRMIAK